MKNLFTNILLTTDFSPCSQATLPYARGLARRYGSTVHLLHVLDPEPTPGHLIPDIDSEDDGSAAERRMKELAGCDVLASISHTQSLKSGVVWDVVSETIRDLGIDLVIVGTHGGHGIRHLILGSVAEKILLRAPCPVLTIGPDTQRRALADGNVTTILCATDFDPGSEDALQQSVDLARTTGAYLTLVHAVDADGSDEELDRLVADAERRSSSLIEPHSDFSCRVVVDRGPAAEVILDKAEQFSADLIVMGADDGPAAAHIPWTVLHQVISKALCPVLTIRH